MKYFIEDKVISDYCRLFNSQDDEPYICDYPNAAAEDFMLREIPRFESPDPVFNEIWYFRWWSFRKHIKTTPYGRVIIEFMPDVRWAGPFNTINCPAGHQLREARWLNDKAFAEEYLQFWFNPDTGALPRKYTYWAATSALDVVSVTGNKALLPKLYPALCDNYVEWKKSHQRENGLFVQGDGWDGMECSIGGSGYRATINSCMAAEARSLSVIARICGDAAGEASYQKEYETLRALMEERLWNEEKKFFTSRREEDESFVDVRELHGYTPWYYFNDMDEHYDCAWRLLTDTAGFMAPYGPTTAERKHPEFKLDLTGHDCKWNGPSWPFSTSVTLTGLAKLLQKRPSAAISKRDYFDTLACYARSNYLREEGRVIPWIDENLDPFTGEWLARKIIKASKSNQPYERGKDYSHSTFADLIITGLCGIDVDFDGNISVNPLLPDECWDYFLLEGVKVGEHTVTVQYDRFGTRYNRGKGLVVYVDGVAQQAAQ